MRILGIALAAAMAAMLAGCGVQEWWLGAKHGVLFQGLDAVSNPGQPVDVRVSLRGGKFLQPRSDYTVIFAYQGRGIGAAKTDDDGLASITYTFPTVGLHEVTASLDPAEIGLDDVPTASVQIGVSPPDQPAVVVDLDKTVVAEGFDQVLLAEPLPLTGSAEVLTDLSRQYTVIYLTHRPEYLAQRSKSWLKTNGFPPGPVLVSSQEEFLSGSEAFKTGQIDRLKKVLPRLELGIGDKISDILAYDANGLKAFLVVMPETFTPGQKLEYADRLDELPADVQVVTDWRQIAEALAHKAEFPPAQMQQRLRALAQAEQARTRPSTTQPTQTQPIAVPEGQP